MRLHSRLLLAVALLPALAGAALAEAAKPCGGIPIPSSAKRVNDDECRFVSPDKWEETIKNLEKNTAGPHKWHREVNIPAAKYVHMESTNPKSPWEGVNVYQLGGEATSEVRIFVIPRPAAKAEPAEAPRKSKGKSRRER